MLTHENFAIGALLFGAGIPCCFQYLAVAAWIKFKNSILVVYRYALRPGPIVYPPQVDDLLKQSGSQEGQQQPQEEEQGRGQQQQDDGLPCYYAAPLMPGPEQPGRMRNLAFPRFPDWVRGPSGGLTHCHYAVSFWALGDRRVSS